VSGAWTPNNNPTFDFIGGWNLNIPGMRFLQETSAYQGQYDIDYVDSNNTQHWFSLLPKEGGGFAVWPADNSGLQLNLGGPNGLTARGNPTQISEWVSGTTYLTSARTYDTTGQVTISQDPKLNYIQYAYQDDYWNDDCANPPAEVSPNTKATNAYITTVKDNIGSTHFGYYYGSGKVAWAMDYNAITTYFHFMDPFERPTETYYPIGWSLNTYTSPTQFDSYAAIGDTTPSAACVSCSHTEALSDHLGRVTSQSLINDPSGQSYVTATYDNMNRAATVSHSNFGAADANDVVETPHYDGMSRSLGVTHPDTQSTKIAYGAGVTALRGLGAQQSSA
jgi:hypothetical protein